MLTWRTCALSASSDDMEYIRGSGCRGTSVGHFTDDDIAPTL